MLSFSNATANLYNRLGKLANLVQIMMAYQQSQLTALTNTTNGVVAQYNAESDIQALIGSAYIGTLNSAGSIGSLASDIAQQTLNRMIFRDNPRIAQTLQDVNTLASLQELIRQMKIAGASVLAMNITAIPQPFSTYVTNVGNAIINTSVKRPLDGLVLENSFAELLQVVCSEDSYSGGATAGNETYNITGTGQETDVLAFDWPLGSNSQNQTQAIDGNTDNGAGNLLTNSDFSAWTAGAPDDYTIVADGSRIFQETGLIYDGTSALGLRGALALAFPEFKQEFDSSTGTLGSLATLSQYSFNIFMRRSVAASGLPGILQIALVDQNGTIINDANGVANSFSITIANLTTDYASQTAVFRTPAILPAQQFLRYRITQAMTPLNAGIAYLAKASMGLMTQVYTSGPFMAIHAGSLNPVQGDYTFVPVTNSRGAAGTQNTWQTVFAKFFPEMIDNELLLPSSATPTISDSALIS